MNQAQTISHREATVAVRCYLELPAWAWEELEKMATQEQSAGFPDQAIDKLVDVVVAALEQQQRRAALA